MKTLDDQVALVTGSSRGIGAAIATELACGAKRRPVAVHGRDRGAVGGVVAAVTRGGGAAWRAGHGGVRPLAREAPGERSATLSPRSPATESGPSGCPAT